MQSWALARDTGDWERLRATADPVDPQARISLDPELLGRFPDGYRHLGYLQTRNGARVNPNLPTASGAALESLVRNAKTWLGQGNGFVQRDARHE